jgi:hypothetical protein
MILCGVCRVGMWLTAGLPTCPRCGGTATRKLAPTLSAQGAGEPGTAGLDDPASRARAAPLAA